LELQSGIQGPAMALNFVIAACALFLAKQGHPLRAVELYARISSRAAVANSRWFEDVFGKPIAAASAHLPPEVVAAAQERGRARDLMATPEELLIELEDWQAVDA
jgi:hypothetical protein